MAEKKIQPAPPQGIELKCVDDIVKFIQSKKLRVVVETGVAFGVSTNAILGAIPDDGLLVSIENNPYTLNSLLVLPKYYKKWLFVYGDSADVLSNVVKLVGSIDLFWHDGLHRATAMKQEYETALPHSRFIGSHDINHPGAGTVWNDFVEEHNMEVLLRRSKWAFARNPDWKPSK